MKVLYTAMAALFALLAASAPATAHIRSTTGYSEIRQDGTTVHYRLGVEYQPLAVAVGLGERGLDGTPAERDQLLRDRHAAIEAYLNDRLVVAVDGVRCEGELAGTGIERRDGKPFASLALDYACPGEPEGAYTVSYGVFADGAVVDDHRSIVGYRLGGASGTYVFDSGHHELEAGAGLVR